MTLTVTHDTSVREETDVETGNGNNIAESTANPSSPPPNHPLPRPSSPSVSSGYSSSSFASFDAALELFQRVTSKSSATAGNGAGRGTDDCGGSSLLMSALTLTSGSYADDSDRSGLHQSQGHLGCTNGARKVYLPQRSLSDSRVRGPLSQSPLDDPTDEDPRAPPPLGDPPRSSSDRLLKPVFDRFFSKRLSWTAGNALGGDLDGSRNSKHGSGRNKRNSNNNNNNNNNNDDRNDPIHDDEDHEFLEAGDSDVERIVHRLEQRNANRLPVPAEVKSRFLKLCDEACKKRVAELAESGTESRAPSGDVLSSQKRKSSLSAYRKNSNLSLATSSYNKQTSNVSSCILRKDIIRIRNSIRLEVESKTKTTRILDEIKEYFGFKNQTKLLLTVINRAVDSIDQTDHAKAKVRRKKSLMNQSSFSGLDESLVDDCLGSVQSGGLSNFDFDELSGGKIGGMGKKRASLRMEMPPSRRRSSLQLELQKRRSSVTLHEDREDEWFYYKDFVFYSLKIESKYPWMKNAGAFSILITFAYYLFTPILWCTILRDEAICPVDKETKSHNSSHGWLTSLYFASTTSSTIGYGDVSIYSLSNEDESDEPGSGRILIAILFMILSLVVSIVGFQAGLDSHFHPFRRKLDLFAQRVIEILEDAGVIQSRSSGKDNYVFAKMRYAKFVLISEIVITFIILNMIGVFALQISLLVTDEDIHISWMQSLYWAVQTTTTIGYGDVSPPEGFRWFLLFYLAISTYAVGSALGKLRELSTKLESMRLLYAWQQQEASHAMLTDFSGKPDSSDGRDEENIEGAKEIDQFEFTIASLVLMGKISSKDIRPIMKKFKKLTKSKPNKITAADVAGPAKQRVSGDAKQHRKQNVESESNDLDVSDRTALNVGKSIVRAFREEVLSTGSVKKAKSEKESHNGEESNHSHFRVPPNTYGIALDDSKFQRKQLAKFFDLIGLPLDRFSIAGNGQDEIIGFEDYVVNFVERRKNDFVLLIVDENLDVRHGTKNETISGSTLVENIRLRLTHEAEKRVLALIRSVNDSATDIAVFCLRAHGFLPKAPIKRDKVNKDLAPLWFKRFPSSEFGDLGGDSETSPMTEVTDDIELLPYKIAPQLVSISDLFKQNTHESNPGAVYEKLYNLKQDVLALKNDISIMSIVGIINVMMQNPRSEYVTDRWFYLYARINGAIIASLRKKFRVPKNTIGIALDDSRTQRDFIVKFFEFIGVPSDQCTAVGDGRDEIMGFEDYVVKFIETHKQSFIFLIVDEHLNAVKKLSTKETISGAVVVKNIRKRLSQEEERRLIALIRSPNNSPSDIAIYSSCAHGLLPDIKLDSAKESIASLWLKRFPPSDFAVSPGYEIKTKQKYESCRNLVVSSQDLAQKIVDIDSLFKSKIDNNFDLIKQLIIDLKKELLIFKFDESMLPIVGMLNVILSEDHVEFVEDSWSELRLRIDSAIDVEDSDSDESSSQDKTTTILSLTTGLNPSRRVALANYRSTCRGIVDRPFSKSIVSLNSSQQLDSFRLSMNQDDSESSRAVISAKSPDQRDSPKGKNSVAEPRPFASSFVSTASSRGTLESCPEDEPLSLTLNQVVSSTVHNSSTLFFDQDQSNVPPKPSNAEVVMDFTAEDLLSKNGRET